MRPSAPVGGASRAAAAAAAAGRALSRRAMSAAQPSGSSCRRWRERELRLAWCKRDPNGKLEGQVFGPPPGSCAGLGRCPEARLRVRRRRERCAKDHQDGAERQGRPHRANSASAGLQAARGAVRGSAESAAVVDRSSRLVHFQSHFTTLCAAQHGNGAPRCMQCCSLRSESWLMFRLETSMGKHAPAGRRPHGDKLTSQHLVPSASQSSPSSGTPFLLLCRPMSVFDRDGQ